MSKAKQIWDLAMRLFQEDIALVHSIGFCVHQDSWGLDIHMRVYIHSGHCFQLNQESGEIYRFYEPWGFYGFEQAGIDGAINILTDALNKIESKRK